MTSRPVLFVVMMLVLLHQLVAGVFAGGTILCISGAGGVALQPVGMTCCTAHGPQATADACCADDATRTCNITPPADCQGCMDHVVSMQPTLPPHAMDLALPRSAPVLIALIPWPSVHAQRASATIRHGSERVPPPLRLLSTVILRC